MTTTSTQSCRPGPGRLIGAILLAVGLGVSACSAKPGTSSPTSGASGASGSSSPLSPVSSGGSDRPSADPSSLPTTATTACPSGNYLVTRLVGHGQLSALGTGTGGNLIASFENGDWSLRSDGSQPMKLDVGIGAADLRINGEIDGRYSGPPDALALSVTEATGATTVKGFGVDEQRTLRQVADKLVPAGTVGTVSCAGEQATLNLPAAELQLARR